MKRVELLSGMLSALFGLGLLVFVPGPVRFLRCVVGGSGVMVCLGGNPMNAGVGLILSLAFLVGGSITAGYALYTAHPA